MISVAPSSENALEDLGGDNATLSLRQAHVAKSQHLMEREKVAREGAVQSIARTFASRPQSFCPQMTVARSFLEFVLFAR